MAIDQTQVSLNIGTKTVDWSKKLLEAINELQLLEAQRAAASINLPAFDASFEASSIPHVNGSKLVNVISTAIPAIWAYMGTNGYDDDLWKMLP